MNISEYLKQHSEPIPQWLLSFTENSSFNAADFFASRVVYYPGHGFDGHAVKLFGSMHAAHCFVYADYGQSDASIKESLDHPTRHFKGYRTLARIDLTQQQITPAGWHPHVSTDHTWATQAKIAPYGFLEVLVRDSDYGEDHGPERLAILFLGADGHATYDALFCQSESCQPPFAVLLQDHDSGGNHSKFGQGGLMEEIAIKAKRAPRFLLVAINTKGWVGYSKVQNTEPDIGGMYRKERNLYAKDI